MTACVVSCSRSEETDRFLDDGVSVEAISEAEADGTGFVAIIVASCIVLRTHSLTADNPALPRVRADSRKLPHSLHGSFMSNNKPKHLLQQQCPHVSAKRSSEAWKDETLQTEQTTELFSSFNNDSSESSRSPCICNIEIAIISVPTRYSNLNLELKFPWEATRHRFSILEVGENCVRNWTVRRQNARFLYSDALFSFKKCIKCV